MQSGLFNAKILSHEALGNDYWALRFESPEFAAAAKPGQFLHLRVPTLEETALRRPFSIWGAEGNEFKVLYKNVGRGTSAMTALRVGTEVNVMGPLGNGFPEPTKPKVLLVAGGYGVAPLCFLASRLKSAAEAKAFIGGRSAADILCAADFRALGTEVAIATQDGSLGKNGLVTDVMPPLDEDCEIFACGPAGMLRAIGERALAANATAWLSLDRKMVCATGACFACVQRLRKFDGTTWLARVCKDGPVFNAKDIVWE